MSKKDKNRQPWVEKYRPKTLNDVYGQKHIIPRLKKFSYLKSVPHLLFVGNAGIGKTTSALAFVREVQGKKMKRGITYIELNASDARGIDVVRNLVKEFAKIEDTTVPFKIIILDECDQLTKDSQQALRGIMQDFSENCRFILICNYSNKLITPIQSRCAVQRFNPLSSGEIRDRLLFISFQEGVMIEDDGIEALIYISDGDARKAINYLQAVSNLDKKITADVVYSVSGQLHPKDVVAFMHTSVIEQDFEKAMGMFYIFIHDYALSAQNFIKQLHKEILNYEVSELQRLYILDILSKYSYRLSRGATEEIQLASMIVELGKL